MDGIVVMLEGILVAIRSAVLLSGLTMQTSGPETDSVNVEEAEPAASDSSRLLEAEEEVVEGGRHCSMRLVQEAEKMCSSWKARPGRAIEF